MKANSGLWIDHREAIIVVLSERGEETRRILSDTERHRGHAGEPSNVSFDARELPADDARQKEHSGHLAHYYDEVIAHLRDAGAILIIGPGEAKGELKKRFETHKGESRVIVVETTDNMTESQVAARVRRHYHQDARRNV